jgi:hypothetical protein
MPRGVFPQGWDVDLNSLLQRKIGKATRALMKNMLFDEKKLIEIAEKFLRLYRAALRTSSTIQNLQTPSLSAPMEGTTSKSESISTPLLGMIGIPASRINDVEGIIDSIRIGQYAQVFITPGATRGILEFNFLDFITDNRAQYHDGQQMVSWPRLVEYGFVAPGWLYLRMFSQGRSDFGIMGKSGKTKIDFEFAGTHVFEDTFYTTLARMHFKELAMLRFEFVG